MQQQRQKEKIIAELHGQSCYSNYTFRHKLQISLKNRIVVIHRCLWNRLSTCGIDHIIHRTSCIHAMNSISSIAKGKKDQFYVDYNRWG